MTTEQETQEAANKHYSYFAEEVAGQFAVIDIADDQGDMAKGDEVREAIQEDPLAVNLDSIDLDGGYAIWNVLLGTGGPATRILVTTTFEGDVQNATFQFQDWFVPWTDAEDQDLALLLRYASAFYYGEVKITCDGDEAQ